MSIQDLFNAFDTDGNGSLDIREFGALLRAFSSRNLPEAEVAALLGRADRDASGCVDFAEFQHAVASAHLRQPLPDLGHLAKYRAADADKDGLLTVAEAAQLAERLGGRLELQAGDPGGCDRLVSYVEFEDSLAR